MKSAKEFAVDFTSTWSLLTPTTDLFVRKINASLGQREFVPLESGTEPYRRGLINETAFQLYCTRSRGSSIEASLEAALQQAAKLIKSLDHREASVRAALSAIERSDVEEQARRIAFYLQTLPINPSRQDLRELVAFPRFSGCGFVDQCHGDILLNDCLVEIKAGDRSFRSVDVRQVLTYCSLNYVGKNHQIDYMALFNPRTGMSFNCSIDDCCFEVSGKRSTDLLFLIAEAMSAGGISR